MFTIMLGIVHMAKLIVKLIGIPMKTMVRMLNDFGKMEVRKRLPSGNSTKNTVVRIGQEIVMHSINAKTISSS